MLSPLLFFNKGREGLQIYRSNLPQKESFLLLLLSLSAENPVKLRKLQNISGALAGDLFKNIKWLHTEALRFQIYLKKSHLNNFFKSSL